MKRSIRILLSVLTGVLLSLAWLGFPGWTLFIAFIPILYLENYFVERKAEFRSVSIWGHAYLAFFIWNLLTTWWIVNATLAGAILAIVANSFIMSMVFWLIHVARRNFKSNLGYVALVVFWISYEYMHYHWDIEWPWLTLGNGFANNIRLVQWYEFTGSFGGSVWILLMNILIFKLLINRLQKRPFAISIKPLISLVLLLLVPVIVSLTMFYSYEEEGESKNIVIVQPNIDPYNEEYDLAAENKKLKTFLSLAEEQIDENTDFVIGPETLFENPSYWNEDKLESNPMLEEMSYFLSLYPKAEMIFGVSSYKVYPDKENAPHTARTGNGMVYDMFNTAIYLENNGQKQIYHKSKLVVGVEKMPFAKYLGFLGDIVINVGGTTNSLGRQIESSNFISKGGTDVAPVICYESVFGEYVTQYVQNGADLIFIITNDGWWKNTPGYHQHLSFASLRAIETRRSIARCANTGISCFINQRGEILQPTKWWVEDSIKGSININDQLTFYVKFGDFIARISLFLSALLILKIIVDRFLRKNKVLR